MTTTFRHVRFERLPSADIRVCYGCGDDAGVPTLAYIDNVTGDIVHCFPGDVPSENGQVHDPRQSTLFDVGETLEVDALDDEDIAALTSWLLEEAEAALL